MSSPLKGHSLDSLVVAVGQVRSEFPCTWLEVLLVRQTTTHNMHNVPLG